MRKGEAPQEPPKKTGNLGSKWGFNCLNLFCRQLSFLLNSPHSQDAPVIKTKERARRLWGILQGFPLPAPAGPEGQIEGVRPLLGSYSTDALQEGELSQRDLSSHWELLWKEWPSVMLLVFLTNWASTGSNQIPGSPFLRFSTAPHGASKTRLTWLPGPASCLSPHA